MSKIRTSVYQSIASKYAVLVVDTIMVITISRLLTPGEIGVYSVCAVIVGFAGILRNSGLPEYIIQEKDLTEDKLRSCFGAMLFVSWACGLVFILFKGELADFFEEPAIESLILIMVVEYFLSPIGINSRAILRRKFEFGTILKIDTTASIVKAIVSVILVLYGFSYYSLAIGSLIGFVSSLLLLFFIKRDDMILVPGFNKIRHVLDFGLPSFGTSAALYIDRYGPEFIIGSFLGFTPVALFNRAMSIRELFEKLIFTSLLPVVMPSFSETYRNKGDVKKIFLKMQSMLLVVGWPFFGVMAVVSLQILRFLFGSQWDEAQDLVIVLCLGGAIWISTSLVPNLMKSIGAVKDLFKYQMAITIVRLVGMIFAASHSILLVVWVFTLSVAINSFFYMFLTKKKIGLSFKEYVVENVNNILVAIITILPSYLIAHLELLPKNDSITTLLVVGLLSVSTWLAIIYYTKNPISSEITFIFKKIANSAMRNRFR